MRRSLLWAGLLLTVLPSAVSAQEQGWAAKFFTGGLKHDFGNVAWGAQLSHKFTITNIYNVPFVVADARVSCGCVTMKKPEGTIPPRGTAELEANMDTRKAGANGQPKIVTVFVTLRSVPQAPNEKVFTSSCTLTVSCLAQSNIRFSNDKMYFGVVNLGQTPKVTLDIQHFTNPGFNITGVAPHEHPVDVVVEKAQPGPGARAAYRVTATLRNNAPAGEIKYEVQLKTNDPVTPVMDVVMDGIVQAPLVAAPNNVDLGLVRIGEVVSGRVVLRGSGAPFKILKVEGEGNGIKVKWAADKSAVSHLVAVEFVPTNTEKVTRTITVRTDLPGDITASFTVTGTGK